MRNRVSTAAFLLGVLGACPSNSPPTRDAGCTATCAAGLTCEAGKCAPKTCAVGSDCAAPLTCVAGFCADVSCAPPCDATHTCLAQVCIPKTVQPCSGSADCPASAVCLAGFCTETGCTPPCAAGEVCRAQVCIPVSSSLCSPPYAACTSASGLYCANRLQDSSNCGACGAGCDAGTFCNGAGQCNASCIPSEALCGSRCVDFKTDESNCGGCGNACAAGTACSGGACATTCAQPYVTCGTGAAAYCADEAHDPSNCGSCGATCSPGQACAGSMCLSPGTTGGTTASGASTTGTVGTTSTSGTTGTISTTTSTSSTTTTTTTTTTTSTTGSATTSGTTSSTSGATAGTTSGTTGTGIPMVSTLAGNGLSAYADGTGGPNGTAEFNYPGGVAVDVHGNVYVADSANNRIRVVAPDGTTATFAGNGTPGFVDGTGGPNGTAEFNYPRGLSLDGQGNVYVADFGNSSIRVIAPNGATTTFAASTTFYGPCGVAVDGQGNVYVADTLSRNGNAIEGLLWVISTTGTTTLNLGGLQATDVAVDGQGNAYVALDTEILVVAPGGTTTALAGGNAAGFADGPSGQAEFNAPQGLALDGQGNVYVADTGNNRIRRVAPDGTTSTLAGSGTHGFLDGPVGTAQFAGPSGVAVDGYGNIYVGDTYNSCIRLVTP